MINMITMGTTECIATHSAQWSASPADAWTCITWATASSASKTRHTTAATFKARCFEWEPLCKPAWDLLNGASSVRVYTELTRAGSPYIASSYQSPC